MSTMMELQQEASTPPAPRRNDSGNGAMTSVWVAVAVALMSTRGRRRCGWWRKRKAPQPAL